MMKKILFVIALMSSIVANAQRFAYVDSDYILERIPEYQSAQEQLEQLSLSWQEEIEKLTLQKNA